jgi:hypothetical protein
VLATNVIELRLKYAKVAPLPGPQPPAPVPVAPLPAAPSRGMPGAPVPQRARPLPPPRPQRSDQPGYDRSRAGRDRYDERRPDQRQIPSGRPYGG